MGEDEEICIWLAWKWNSTEQLWWNSTEQLWWQSAKQLWWNSAKQLWWQSAKQLWWNSAKQLWWNSAKQLWWHSDKQRSFPMMEGGYSDLRGSVLSYGSVYHNKYKGHMMHYVETCLIFDLRLLIYYN